MNHLCLYVIGKNHYLILDLSFKNSTYNKIYICSTDTAYNWDLNNEIIIKKAHNIVLCDFYNVVKLVMHHGSPSQITHLSALCSQKEHILDNTGP